MLKVVNISLPLDYTEDTLKKELASRLRVAENDIKNMILDHRELVKGEMRFKASVLCELDKETEHKLALVLRKKGVSSYDEPIYQTPRVEFKKRPVVAGFGPAGIFASLVLAEAGARPIVLERGSDTKKRIEDVNAFSNGGALNPESNIQFGEGGAGAFSDGKLKIGYKDSIKRKILSELVEAGADSSILYLEKAHIGSDVLHSVIVRLREKIIALGGEVHFNSRLAKINVESQQLVGITYECEGKEYSIETDSLVLATGHSARDTYRYLYDAGLDMVAKGFGIGVRIEHRQELINAIEYGRAEYAETLGSADYKMVTHLDNGRSLYTFCMCPGGYVVPASSEENSICTNGMSEFARDGDNANTALLVSVTPEDFPSSHALAGIELQQKIEQLAFEIAGSDYSAPVIRLEDFMARRESEAFGEVLPTYKPSTKFVSPDRYLPDYICESLRLGIEDMCRYKEGYYCPDAVLTGPETRTTSPVKIVRGENLEASIGGIYPAGEGAGYAGGIISSAVDGMMCAKALMKGKEK